MIWNGIKVSCVIIFSIKFKNLLFNLYRTYRVQNLLTTIVPCAVLWLRFTIKRETEFAVFFRGFLMNCKARIIVLFYKMKILLKLSTVEPPQITRTYDGILWKAAKLTYLYNFLLTGFDQIFHEKHTEIRLLLWLDIFLL